jgi:selenide,water dikinase
VTLAPELQPWQQALLTDPQTSGGLLVSCAPAAAAQVLARFHATGFGQAAVIGRMRAGAPRLEIRLS